MSRQVDRENTSRSRLVAHCQKAAVRVNAAPRDRQSQSHAALVAADLAERLEQFFRVFGGQSYRIVRKVPLMP